MRSGYGTPLVVVVVVVSLGCATIPRREPTALEAQIATCILAALVGAGVGAGLGAAVDGSDGAKKGGGIGLVAGGAICGVVLAMNNRDDKARISHNQESALESGETVREEYVGANDRKRVVTTSVRNAQPKSMPDVSSGDDITAERYTGICRYRQTNIEYEGVEGVAELDEELFCRTEEGDWLPHERESV